MEPVAISITVTVDQQGAFLTFTLHNIPKAQDVATDWYFHIFCL